MKQVIDGFYLSQSGVKYLEQEDYCPAKFYHSYVTKEHRPPSNKHMERGIYFETLCLGSGVDGKIVAELPFEYLKNGNKSVRWKRIDEQAEYFKRLFNKEDEKYLGYEIVEKDYVVKDSRDRGVIDFILRDQEGKIWLADLKLTSMINARHKWSWGRDPKYIDFLQQHKYVDLYEYQEGKDIEGSLVFVFDYTPKKDKKLFQITHSDEDIKEANNRFESAVEVIEHYKKEGFHENPSDRECSECVVPNCPLKLL